MIATEKEARELRCCVTGCGAHNESVRGVADAAHELTDEAFQTWVRSLPRYCIGSKCMGWEWEVQCYPDGSLNYAGANVPAPVTNEQGERLGRCGRAK